MEIHAYVISQLTRPLDKYDSNRNRGMLGFVRSLVHSIFCNVFDPSVTLLLNPAASIELLFPSSTFSFILLSRPPSISCDLPSVPLPFPLIASSLPPLLCPPKGRGRESKKERGEAVMSTLPIDSTHYGQGQLIERGNKESEKGADD